MTHSNILFLLMWSGFIKNYTRPVVNFFNLLDVVRAERIYEKVYNRNYELKLKLYLSVSFLMVVLGARYSKRINFKSISNKIKSELNNYEGNVSNRCSQDSNREIRYPQLVAFDIFANSFDVNIFINTYP